MKITESRNEIYKGRYAIEVFVRSLEDGTFNVPTVLLGILSGTQSFKMTFRM